MLFVLGLKSRILQKTRTSTFTSQDVCSAKPENPDSDCYVQYPCTTAAASSNHFVSIGPDGFPTVDPPTYESLFPSSSRKRCIDIAESSLHDRPMKLTNSSCKQDECLLKKHFGCDCQDSEVVEIPQNWENADVSRCFGVSIPSDLSGPISLCHQHYQVANLHTLNKHYCYCAVCFVKLVGKSKHSVPPEMPFNFQADAKLCSSCYKETLQSKTNVDVCGRFRENTTRLIGRLNDFSSTIVDKDIELQNNYLPDIAFLEVALSKCKEINNGKVEAFLLIDLYDEYL